jgi:two-component system sensor histidine kinase RegB
MAPPAAETHDSSQDVAFLWLVRTRWAATAAFAAAVAVAHLVLQVELQRTPLFVLWGLALATNAAAAWVPKRHQAAIGAWLLSFDVVVLTLILAISGGPTNPFSALYLVYVTLAAMTLSGRATAALTALAIVAYGGLFVLPLDALDPHAGHDMGHQGHATAYDAHLYGMFLAFAVTAALLAGFITRLAGALRRREQELHLARAAVARGERLSALATLSAGAAHELGTPLGTIALVAREMEKAAEAEQHMDALRQDAALVRAEVDRCRAILDRMAGRTGEPAGEALRDVTVATLIDAVRDRLHAPDAQRVQLDEGADLTLRVPLQAMTQVVENLVRNGLDAAPRGGVRVRAERAADGRARLVVADDGTGMNATELARAGEPFYTTKDVGRGMGLGIYLARAVVEQLGGTFALRSDAGVGTEVCMELPA